MLFRSPIAQIFGNTPDEAQGSAAPGFDLPRGTVQKGFRGCPSLVRQDGQKLSAATRPQQDFRQAQFGQQSPGQDFGQQADPMRTSRENVVRVRTRGSEQEVVDAENLAFEKYLDRQEKTKPSGYHAQARSA